LEEKKEDFEEKLIMEDSDIVSGNKRKIGIGDLFVRNNWRWRWSWR